MTLWLPLATVSLECLERIIPSTRRFLRLPFPVRVRLMGDTMLTLRLSAKPSTFAQLMEPEVWHSTASSVPMEHSSTRTTSSVTGGSTLTALPLRNSTPSMTRLLPNVRPSMLLLLRVLPVMLSLTMPPLPLSTLQKTPPLKSTLQGEEGDWEATAGGRGELTFSQHLFSTLTLSSCLTSQPLVPFSSSPDFAFHFLGCFIHLFMSCNLYCASPAIQKYKEMQQLRK